MIAYVDSSVLLRVLLREARALPEWASIETAVASALVRVECLRTIDRLRLGRSLDDAESAAHRAALLHLFTGFDVVEPAGPVLERAAHPFPTALGTLDAIHLATALLWRERSGTNIVMATHDAALGLAARAVGLAVVGI